MDQFLFPGKSVHSDRILYTPSSFAKNNLFYLQETGTLAAQKTYVNRRKDLASYLFFIVLKGSGTLRYQNVEHTLHYSGREKLTFKCRAFETKFSRKR